MPNPQPLSYEPTPSVRSQGRWILLEVVNTIPLLQFPAYCCQCLQPTYHKYEVPSISALRLDVFLCPDCTKRWKRRYNRVLRLGAAAAFVSSLSAALLTECHTLTERIGVFACATFIALVALAVVVHYTGNPMLIGFTKLNHYRCRVWVRFPNADYFKLFERVPPAPSSFPVPPSALLSKKARARNDGDGG